MTYQSFFEGKIIKHDFLVQIAYYSQSKVTTSNKLLYLQPKFQPSSHRSKEKRKGRKKQ